MQSVLSCPLVADCTACTLGCAHATCCSGIECLTALLKLQQSCRSTHLHIGNTYASAVLAVPSAFNRCVCVCRGMLALVPPACVQLTAPYCAPEVLTAKLRRDLQHTLASLRQQHQLYPEAEEQNEKRIRFHQERLDKLSEYERRMQMGSSFGVYEGFKVSKDQRLTLAAGLVTSCAIAVCWY